MEEWQRIAELLGLSVEEVLETVAGILFNEHLEGDSTPGAESSVECSV